jgi:hypothetical protein
MRREGENGFAKPGVIESCHPTAAPPPLSTEKCKENGRFAVPDLQDVKTYFLQLDCAEQAVRFYDHHQTRGWILSNGRKMVDWQAACRTWIHNIDRFSSNGYSKKPPPHVSALQTAAQERLEYFRQLRQGMTACTR